jgi:hypothetical protein
LRRLLETKLDTYEKLELAVVLARRPETQESVTELARELQVGEDVMRRLATDLSRTGLVAVTPEDKVQLSATPDEMVTLAEGAEFFEGSPRKVISLLSTIAMDRIRGMAARSFADAFSLRKKKDENDG